MLLVPWGRWWYIHIAHWTGVCARWKPTLSQWHLIINLAQQRKKLQVPSLRSSIKSLLVPVKDLRQLWPQTWLPGQSPPHDILPCVIWQRFSNETRREAEDVRGKSVGIAGSWADQSRGTRARGGAALQALHFSMEGDTADTADVRPG